jgi:hypothetical protein
MRLHIRTGQAALSRAERTLLADELEALEHAVTGVPLRRLELAVDVERQRAAWAVCLTVLLDEREVTAVQVTGLRLPPLLQQAFGRLRDELVGLHGLVRDVVRAQVTTLDDDEDADAIAEWVLGHGLDLLKRKPAGWTTAQWLEFIARHEAGNARLCAAGA